MAAAMSALTSKASGFSGRTVASRRSGRVQARSSGVIVQASDRPLWFPGQPAPSYLDGSLPGDYGFDPLKLADDAENLKWLAHSELIHGRTAMTGVAGILIPGLLTKIGILNVPEWYEAGKVYIDENPSVSFGALAWSTLILCGFVELKRWEDFNAPGSQADGSFLGITDDFKGVSNGYPGGRFFDFLGYSRGDPKAFAEYKVKEVKNGRLAMVAFFGFVAQWKATGKGPIDNLFDHIADPTHVTFATNGVSLPFLY